MLIEIRAKSDAKRILHLTKIIAMTLFAGYAADHSAELLFRDSLYENFGKYDWYYKFSYVVKLIYVLASSGVFYLLISRKYNNKSY